MAYQNKKRKLSNDLDQDQQPHQKTDSTYFLLPRLEAMISSPESLSYIESRLRSPVREEVEKQVKNFVDHPRSSSSIRHVRDRSGDQDEAAGNGRSRRVKLKLCFVNKIQSIIFTKNTIEAENGQPLKVALWDTTTNSYCNLEGLNSAEIEFFVLDGEFGYAQGEQQDDIHWSVAEFDKNIITQEKDEKPLLAGNDKKTRLKNGVLIVNDLTFTANSSRTRTKKFRLGVRINPVIRKNYPIRIGEAVSNPVRVKDHRVEAIQKNHPPMGEDKVNRLEGIGKYRQERLAAENIQTVDDFLKALQTDPANLRKLLGKRVSDKEWNVLLNHVSEYDPLIPTFDANSQLNINQPIMNPISYNNNYDSNGFGGICFDQLTDDHSSTFQGLSPLLPQLGEASTSYPQNYGVENFNQFDQHFQEPWPRT